MAQYANVSDLMDQVLRQQQRSFDNQRNSYGLGSLGQGYMDAPEPPPSSALWEFARRPLPQSKTLGEKAPNLTLREELQAETDKWLQA